MFFGGFSRRHSGLCREKRRQKTPSQDGKRAKIFSEWSNDRFGFNPMAYGLFAARHHLHPQRGSDLRLRSPGDLDSTAQSGLPFELKIADLTQDGAHAKCATKPLTGARYHDTATGWGLYLLFIYNANRQLPRKGYRMHLFLSCPKGESMVCLFSTIAFPAFCVFLCRRFH